MSPLNFVNLPPVMKLTNGNPRLKVGLIDGPVAMDQSAFAHTPFQIISGKSLNKCAHPESLACHHGTFVAGILSAQRQSIAPAICPNCTLVIRPIFSETTVNQDYLPSTEAQHLATAILDCINAGVRLINLSLELSPISGRWQKTLKEVLDYATHQGVIIVAAAGNQGSIASSIITRHASVIPIVACDLRGQPAGRSNLANSIGKRGLRAPGEIITSIGSNGKPRILSGTSAATPFVTGTIALLWSEFLQATASQIRIAVTRAYTRRQHSIVPPLLNAWESFEFMRKEHQGY